MEGQFTGTDFLPTLWIRSKWLTTGDLDFPPAIRPSVSDVESNREVEPEQEKMFDESLQLLQRLIQQNLGAVIESDLSQFSTYPQQVDMTPKPLLNAATIIAYALDFREGWFREIRADEFYCKRSRDSGSFEFLGRWGKSSNCSIFLLESWRADAKVTTRFTTVSSA